MSPSLSSGSGDRHDSNAVAVSPSWNVEVDLHLHTTASDGLKSPTEIVDMAGERSLRLISITDHDTTDSLAEAAVAARKWEGLTLIPGVELSTYTANTEVHLTCHFIDSTDRALQGMLSRLVRDRETKAQQIVDRLISLGVEITWEEVKSRANGTIGRPHIARALISSGYVGSVSEAFDRYLDGGRPAYVSRMKLDTFEGLDLIHAAGGVATVAHPRTVGGLESLIGPLADAGLVGLEVYAEKYDSEMMMKFAEMADAHGLIRSGGTDYHANGTPNEVLPGANGPPPETGRLLYERALMMHGEDGVGSRFDLGSL